MAKHHADLVMCMKQPGISIGRLCERCDGKCPVCDSHVRPHTLVRICDECSFGALEGRCIICGAPGVADAYYCRECTIQEKDVEFLLFGVLAGGVRRLLSASVARRSFFAHTRRRSPLSTHARPPPHTQQRDGCVRIINLSTAQKDLFYERKRYGKKG